MTTTDKITEEPEISETDYIKRFSQRIIRERTGNFKSLKKTQDGKIIFPEVDSKVSTNRGNKLLQNAEGVSRKRMYNDEALKEPVIYYNGSEHKLLHRKRMRFFPPEVKNTVDDDQDEEINLHKLVNVRDILTPISSLSDVVDKPHIARTFQSKIINDLSLKTVLMIEKEQKAVNQYSKLLDVFLGDHPGPLYESNLKLKEYDHNLILPEDKEEGDADSPENHTKSTEPLKQNEENEDEDPFFALPQISNKDGLSLLMKNQSEQTSTTTTAGTGANDENQATMMMNEQIELTRQMTQIALQRNEEFIRNLLKIRNFLDKATRIRERILAWGKESAGIQDEGVTVPNVLRVVKRGLISATTNKTVTDEEAEQEQEEGSEQTNKEPANK